MILRSTVKQFEKVKVSFFQVEVQSSFRIQSVCCAAKGVDNDTDKVRIGSFVKHYYEKINFCQRFDTFLFRLEAREAGLIEQRPGDKQMARNGKIRTTIKRMFENGEIGLAKLMRQMGALWTKTQAAKKARGQVRRQQADEAAGDPQAQQVDQALRQVLQSVTDDVDPDAAEARQGRAWQEGRGGGRARPARGRGAGRGRGGRVQGAQRARCDRCGEDYARTYLRYHQRRCVGVMDHAWGEGRGGILARGRRQGGEEPQVQRGQQQGEGGEAAAQDPQVQPQQGGGGEQQQGEGGEAGEAAAQDPQVQPQNLGARPRVQRGQQQGGGGQAAARDQLEDDYELSDLDDEELGDLEDDNDEDILAEVDEMERTVFADVPEARGRGQKRTAMSVSSSEDESQDSPLFHRPRRNLRRRSYWLGDHLLDTPPTPQQPQVPQGLSPPPPRRPVVAQPGVGPAHRRSLDESNVDLQLPFEVSAETEGLVAALQQHTRGDIFIQWMPKYL